MQKSECLKLKLNGSNQLNLALKIFPLRSRKNTYLLFKKNHQDFNPQNNQKDWKRSCQYLDLFSSIFLYYSSNRVPKILFNKEAQQEKFFLNVIFNLDHNVFFHLTPYLLSTNFESVNSFAVILNLKCAPINILLETKST